MPNIIVNTYSSIASIIRRALELPDWRSDDHIMSWRYHELMKQPHGSIVAVKRSSYLSNCLPDVDAALDQFERDALGGGLGKYLCKGAKKIGGKHDGLLYRSGIWHFHILPLPRQKIHSNKCLVYAFFWENILYLLDIGTHKPEEFKQDRYYLELIDKEWPGVLLLGDSKSEVLLLGGGEEANGESTLISAYYRNIEKFARYADSILEHRAAEIKFYLNTNGRSDILTITLDCIDYGRDKKKETYPLYAFCYSIRGTDSYILIDLIEYKSSFRFLTRHQCKFWLSQINKGIKRAG